VAPRAHAQVFEVELENIVPFDRVGIQFAQDVVEPDQQAFLTGVVLRLQHQQFAAVAALQADGEDPVPRIAGVAEAAGLRRRRLDVELAPAELAEMQVRIEAGALLQEKLTLERPHRVAPAPAHRLLEQIDRGERIGVRQPRERAFAPQPLDVQPFDLRIYRRIRDPGKRAKRGGALLASAVRPGHGEMRHAVSIDPHAAQRAKGCRVEFRGHASVCAGCSRSKDRSCHRGH